MNQVRLSIRVKMLLISFLVLMLFGLSAMFDAYSKIKTSNIDSMNKELHAYSILLAENLEIDKVKSVVNKPEASNPDVIEMHQQMDDIIRTSDSNIGNLYLVTLKDGHFYFPTLSTSAMDGNLTYGSEYTTGGPVFNEPAKKAYETKSSQTTAIYSDDVGTWITSFYPIMDNDGKVLALYAVDYEVSKVNEKAWNETKSFLVLLIIFLIVSGVIFYLVVSKMIKPIVDLANTSQRIAQGDLTVDELKVRTQDEIGLLSASFNQMVSNLRNVIHHVSKSTEQVSASAEELTASAEQTSKASAQIATTIQEVAAGADIQVQSIEASSQAMGNLATGVKQIAATAQGVSQAANQTSEKAELGNDAIQTAVQQMNSINLTVNELAKVIKGLGERSLEIGQITEVITSISAQTNLLALNAAIEAARAGEHGRGFAVVADEVRKLAEQSVGSAQQISQLIAHIQDETSKAVESMGMATREVMEGIGVVNTAGESFEQIQGSVIEVARQIQEVSAASEQMLASTTQVHQAIDSVTEVALQAASGTQNVSAAAQEQFASMEEISTSANSLSKMAEDLQTVIGTFKL
ncbi:methyl-accepting chemotaxis protein [Brevibacillus ginsengisoli]|uniref:methyl-accepting chemotaxis protein n=1 Tax=Brevibacillus ginsengisoli TaxID=363854 RepID=UPI003CF6068D